MKRPGFKSSDDDESEYTLDLTAGVTWLQLLWLPSYAELPGATGDLMVVSISIPLEKNRGEIFILNRYEKKFLINLLTSFDWRNTRRVERFIEDSLFRFRSWFEGF